jgi:hypothetical protein
MPAKKSGGSKRSGRESGGESHQLTNRLVKTLNGVGSAVMFLVWIYIHRIVERALAGAVGYDGNFILTVMWISRCGFLAVYIRLTYEMIRAFF